MTDKTNRSACNGNEYREHEVRGEDGTIGAEFGKTGTCSTCGEAVIGDYWHSYSATLGDDVASVSDEGPDMDPLLLLAQAIGASMPFTVERVDASRSAYWNEPTVLVGNFKGNSRIRVSVRHTRELRWLLA